MKDKQFSLPKTPGQFRMELVEKHCIKRLHHCELAAGQKKGGCFMSTDRGCAIIEGVLMNHKPSSATHNFFKHTEFIREGEYAANNFRRTAKYQKKS